MYLYVPFLIWLPEYSMQAPLWHPGITQAHGFHRSIFNQEVALSKWSFESKSGHYKLWFKVLRFYFLAACIRVSIFFHSNSCPALGKYADLTVARSCTQCQCFVIYLVQEYLAVLGCNIFLYGIPLQCINKLQEQKVSKRTRSYTYRHMQQEGNPWLKLFIYFCPYILHERINSWM